MSVTIVSSNTLTHPDHLPRRMAVVVFLAFALAYFFSALVRAITATLSPTLTSEFSLRVRKTSACWQEGTFWAFRSPNCL